MSSSFRRPIMLKRKSAGTIVDGYWVEGAVSEITITASVQPLTPAEVEQLPEGRRNKIPFWLFTDTKLNDVTKSNPDLVVIGGEDYEIDKVATWQNNVINHYKCLVFKIETPGGIQNINAELNISVPIAEVALSYPINAILNATVPLTEVAFEAVEV